MKRGEMCWREVTNDPRAWEREQEEEVVKVSDYSSARKRVTVRFFQTRIAKLTCGHTAYATSDVLREFEKHAKVRCSSCELDLFKRNNPGVFPNSETIAQDSGAAETRK